MDSGVMESNWLTPIPRLLILIGHSVTNLIVTTITSFGMLIVCKLVFGFHPTGDVLKAVGTIIPMLIGLYGFGFAFAGLVLILREATRGFLLKTNTLLPLNVEVIILIAFMFIMLWFGSWIFHRIERRVRSLGTLGQH
jgi:ABC-2 type transport system permease protein